MYECVDGYAKCKNCDGLIQMSSTVPVSFWQHVETSSVWCGPGGKPVGMGDRRKASPVTAKVGTLPPSPAYTFAVLSEGGSKVSDSKTVSGTVSPAAKLPLCTPPSVLAAALHIDSLVPRRPLKAAGLLESPTGGRRTIRLTAAGKAALRRP
jgi:hypothetical protein